MHVLIAEDDPRIAKSLAALRSARPGLSAEVEADGENAWFRGDTEDFDAIILDLGLPSLDGLTMLKRWRKAGRTSPVLILTARGQWDERVEGIEAGADDYVVKPFRIEEVVARIRAHRPARRRLRVARASRSAIWCSTRAPCRFRATACRSALTPQEYRLLAYLAHQRGRVVSQIGDHRASLRAGFRARIPTRSRCWSAACGERLGKRHHQDPARLRLLPAAASDIEAALAAAAAAWRRRPVDRAGAC